LPVGSGSHPASVISLHLLPMRSAQPIPLDATP
jgi:hypothetical protein